MIAVIAKFYYDLGAIMETLKLLREVELFRDLRKEELALIVTACTEEQLQEGDVFIKEGELGAMLCIIKDGLMEVEINQGADSPPRVLVHLGAGQLVGEMCLVDRGPRSATVRAIHTPTNILVLQYGDFHALCEKNTRIGYMVMRNMAADLSFKVRHRSLSSRGGRL